MPKIVCLNIPKNHVKVINRESGGPFEGGVWVEDLWRREGGKWRTLWGREGCGWRTFEGGREGGKWKIQDKHVLAPSYDLVFKLPNVSHNVPYKRPFLIMHQILILHPKSLEQINNIFFHWCIVRARTVLVMFTMQLPFLLPVKGQSPVVIRMIGESRTRKEALGRWIDLSTGTNLYVLRSLYISAGDIYYIVVPIVVVVVILKLCLIFWRVWVYQKVRTSCAILAPPHSNYHSSASDSAP